MQQSSFELAGGSMLAPALVAGAVVVSFFLCHYSTERKHRREFLRWCETRPQPLTESLAASPTRGSREWTHPSGLYGAGTAVHGVGAGADSVGSFLYNYARRYALAILFVVLALGLRLWLEPVLQGRLPYVLFSAAVLCTAVFAGIWETLLALILGFLAAEWFIVEPRSSFMIAGMDGWLGAVLYFIIGLGIVWFKRSEKAAQSQALASDIAYLDQLKDLERERALRAMLMHIVETCQDAVFSLTREARIMTWNAATERLFGFSGQEAIGQPLAFILPPKELPEAERILGTLQRGEPAQQWRTTLNRKDGTRVAASLSAASVRDADGKVVGVSVVARC